MTILEKYGDAISENIVVGSLAAFITDDEDSGGYYIVKWLSESYTLQGRVVLKEYDPPMILDAGELVCDA